MKSNKKQAELPQITLNRYHKKLAVFNTAAGTSWIIYSLTDGLLSNISNKSTVWGAVDIIVNLAVLLSIIICTFMTITYSTNYKREREDELYQQNTARANRVFIELIYLASSLLIISSVIFDGVKISINFALISGIVTLFLAVYHYLVLYYDRPLKTDYEEE